MHIANSDYKKESFVKANESTTLVPNPSHRSSSLNKPNGNFTTFSNVQENKSVLSNITNTY
jgi:hypothetical protein